MRWGYRYDMRLTYSSPQQNHDWSTNYSMDEEARANEKLNAGSFIPINGAPEPLENMGHTGDGASPSNPSALG